MNSNLVSVVMVLIVVAFCFAAYHYWQGGGKSDRPIAGLVIDKFERPAGTEAGGKPAVQGMRALTGQSLRQDMFYYIRVRTEVGAEIDIEVPSDFYQRIQIGERVRRASRDSVPTKAM
jgi:hypothetical protein